MKLLYLPPTFFFVAALLTGANSWANSPGESKPSPPVIQVLQIPNDGRCHIGIRKDKTLAYLRDCSNITIESAPQ